MKLKPLTKKQIAKLERLKKFLRKEPRRFDMDWWGVKIKNIADLPTLEKSYDLTGVGAAYNTLAEQKPPCGTVACLAGNIAIMAKLIQPEQLQSRPGLEEDNVYLFPPETAQMSANWLGIHNYGKLFFTSDMSHTSNCWSEKFSRAYRKAKTPKEKVEIACEVIDYYIKNGIDKIYD